MTHREKTQLVRDGCYAINRICNEIQSTFLSIGAILDQPERDGDSGDTLDTSLLIIDTYLAALVGLEDENDGPACRSEGKRAEWDAFGPTKWSEHIVERMHDWRRAQWKGVRPA